MRFTIPSTGLLFHRTNSSNISCARLLVNGYGRNWRDSSEGAKRTLATGIRIRSTDGYRFRHRPATQPLRDPVPAQGWVRLTVDCVTGSFAVRNGSLGKALAERFAEGVLRWSSPPAVKTR